MDNYKYTQQIMSSGDIHNPFLFGIRAAILYFQARGENTHFVFDAFPSPVSINVTALRGELTLSRQMSPFTPE